MKAESDVHIESFQAKSLGSMFHDHEGVAWATPLKGYESFHEQLHQLTCKSLFRSASIRASQPFCSTRLSCRCATKGGNHFSHLAVHLANSFPDFANRLNSVHGGCRGCFEV
jgi:hypothetical protein